MIINFSPFRSDDELSVTKQGAVLILNGESFDFSSMGDGDTLPLDAFTSQWFGYAVTRTGETLEVTLRLPLPANFSPEQAYPVPLLNVPDGAVQLPQPLPTPIIAGEVTQ
ncbi:hypothetical protein JFU49_12345 [Pseudomonas sp. TH03]|uniref:hypothetical protein n=1 Tax=Pseudomonas sp. TH03 TaxID=2796369 RepID=UPI00191476E3|nr:hypothetical protein [Pseudomonas sp. TH03]MBK5551048.1 hypothetical protein [Pseudomonas sp. TH03]